MGQRHPKRFSARLKGSYTALVAQVACETGISPTDLLDTDPDLFDAIVQYLRDKNQRRR